MALPTRVGFSTANNSASSTTIVTLIPDGTVLNGMWMIAVVESISPPVDPTPPAGGWTSIGSIITAGTFRSGVFAKKFVTGETSYVFNVQALASASLMWFSNVADTGWVTGAVTLRANTGSTFNNIASSVRTTTTDNLVLALSGERTTATETGISSITNATEWFFCPQVSTATNTVEVAYINHNAGGDTLPVTIVYPNTQASNGWAFQLALPSTTSVTAPAAIFTPTSTGLNAAFDGTASTTPSGTITTYAWDFGDSTTATGVTATHTYAATGTYRVGLTVTNSSGLIGITYTQVTVTNSPPTASFSISASGLTVVVNGSASSDSDGTIASYAWNFGDTATATGVTATHTYAATGTYTIGLTVTDNAGGTNTATQNKSVVAATAALTIVGTSQTRVSTAQTSLTLTPDGTISNGNWMIAVLTYQDTPYSAIVPPAGWNVVQAMWNSGTMQTAIFAKAFVTGETSYTFTVSSTKFWAGTLTWFANAADWTSWVIGAPQNRSVDSYTNIAPAISTLIDNNIILTVSVERTNAAESAVSSITNATQVYYAAQVGIAQPASTILLASSTQATHGTTSPVTIIYPNPQAINGSALQIAIAPIVPAGDAIPTAAFTYAARGYTIDFDGTGSTDTDGTIVSYAWDFNDGTTATTPTYSHLYGTAGTYTVQLTVMDNNGAKSTVSHSVVVGASLLAPAKVGYTTADTGSGGSAVTLTPDGTITAGMWLVTVLTNVAGTTASHTAPTGWEQLGSFIDVGTTYSSVWRHKRLVGDVGYLFSVTDTTALTAAMFWLSGADDTDWVIGAQALRSVTGTSTTNVAPGITTHSSNNLILTTSVERTLTDETDISGITNATEWFFKAQNVGATNTIAVGTSVKATAGLTADVTVTYPNVQTINGWAGQIAVPPAAAAGNVAPVPAFTFTTSYLTVQVNATTSSDSNGVITTYAWDFGDTVTATGSTAAHSYAVSGTYTVTLAVTDDVGAVSTLTHSVTVSAELISVHVWDGTTELAATANYWDGAAEHAAAAVSLVQPNYTITDLLSTTPFFLGHRGSGQVWPEHTLEAYRGAIAAGAKAIELSVQKTSDGVWVCHHDLNALRMTGQSYDISSTPYATLATLTNNGTQSLLGPNSSTPPIPKLSDVLNEVWGKVVLMVECKSGTSANIDEMFGTILPAKGSDYLQRVISKSHQTNVYASTQPRALGYKAWVYTNQTITDPDLASIAARADYLGAPTYPYSSSTMADVDVQRLVATGLPVIGWEMWYKWQTAKYLSLGVHGFMSSALPYNSRGPRRTSDNFVSGLRMAGDFKYSGDADPTWSGNVLSMPSGVTSTMMGSMYVPSQYAAGGYAIDFEMQWQTVAGDTTLHHGIAFGKADDRRYKFGIIPETPGYHLILRRNGLMALYAHNTSSSTGTPLSADIATTAITSTSTWAHIRVAITSTTITFQRLDDGSTSTTVVTDATYRGQFFAICQNNATDLVRFRNVKLSLL